MQALDCGLRVWIAENLGVQIGRVAQLASGLGSCFPRYGLAAAEWVEEAFVVMSIDGQRDLLLKRWESIERGIRGKSGHDYYQEWASRRRQFYKECGPIPCSAADTERLSGLRGAFKGERIFALGNGPSLTRTPLELLQDEFTFVTGRFYSMFDRIAWRPTFYTASDWDLTPRIAHEIDLLTGMVFFFGYSNRYQYQSAIVIATSRASAVFWAGIANSQEGAPP